MAKLKIENLALREMRKCFKKIAGTVFITYLLCLKIHDFAFKSCVPSGGPATELRENIVYMQFGPVDLCCFNFWRSQNKML